MSTRTVVLSLILAATVWFVWPFVYQFWADTISGWGSHRVYIQWFDQAYALLWAMTFAYFFGAGAILAAITRSPYSIVPASILGGIFALAHFLLSRNWFSDNSGFSPYVWTYGFYAMPPLGAIAGTYALRFARRILRNVAA